MAGDVTVGVRLTGDASGSVRALTLTRGELDKLQKEMQQTARATVKMERELGGINAGFGKLQKAASVAGTAMTLFFAAASGASAISAIVRINDSYTRMASRLRLVTDSAQELTQTQDKLFALSQETRSEFEGVVDLYVNLAANTKGLWESQQQLIDVVRVANQAIQISGATAEEASAGVRQLIQGLSSGELRGEELRSVMEQTRRLARAIADGLGTDMAGLRAMAEAGELTTARVLQALMSQADEVDAQFQRIERTVSQAMVQLGNSVSQAVARADMSELVEALDELRGVVSDPQVQHGIGNLATLAVNFVADMAKALALLGDALTDLSKTDELFAAVAKRLINNSGPGFLYRMLGDGTLTGRLDEVLNARPRAGATASSNVSQIPTIQIRGGHTAGPIPNSFFDPFTNVSIDDLIQSREREIAKLDELMFKQFGKADAPGMGMEVALPNIGTESIDELNDKLLGVMDTSNELKGVATQVGISFSSAFADAVVSGGSLSEMLKALVEDTIKLILQTLLLKAIQTGINAAFGGADAAATTTTAAHGAVFDQNGMTPFAKGGIVTRPTLFKFASGTGLMGEAGPEAIMPLKRIGGNLGVQSSGGGVVVNINNHSQAQVSTNSRKGPDGQQVIDVMVEDSFNRLLGSGRLDQSLAANMGVRRPGRF